jgi:tetratricopeptide (TPR) repeat protein
VRAEARLAQGKAEDAEQDCGVLLAQKEPRAFDLRLCALVARVSKSAALERERLDECLVVAPNDTAALALHAELNQREGRMEESLADYSRLLNAAPGHAPAWNNRAWLYVTLGEYASARADADRAVALAPDSAPELGTRCFALAGVGELEKARADCARSIELAPDNPIDLGMLAFLDKRYPDARRHWDLAIARDPANAPVLRRWLDRLPR